EQPTVSPMRRAASVDLIILQTRHIWSINNIIVRVRRGISNASVAQDPHVAGKREYLLFADGPAPAGKKILSDGGRRRAFGAAVACLLLVSCSSSSSDFMTQLGIAPGSLEATDGSANPLTATLGQNTPGETAPALFRPAKKEVQ